MSWGVVLDLDWKEVLLLWSDSLALEEFVKAFLIVFILTFTLGSFDLLLVS